jgi:2',3'-cyclic-nucleotide 2'-phosphodiesterase/3'-nucleotidase
MHTKKCAGRLPAVLANVYSSKTKKPLVQPYAMLERTVVAKGTDGKEVKLPIKIGVIGFTTPGIMNWDKRYLEGKVYTEGAVEAAQVRAELRAKGADIVVALLHGGLDSAAYSPTMENPGLHLSKVAGIDAMVMGHQHGVFPDTAATPSFNLPGVDHKAGTVNGVPAVMASSWGKALGVVQLALQWDGASGWSTRLPARASCATSRARSSGANVYVEPDPTIAPLIETQHQAAIKYVKTPIGQTDFRMSTLFADVGDPGAIQIVNQAQQAYVAAYIRPTCRSTRAAGAVGERAVQERLQGGADYTDVAVGPLAINNAADLYLYPNTVYAVKVNGATSRTGWKPLPSASTRSTPPRPPSSSSSAPSLGTTSTCSPRQTCSTRST